MDDGLGDRSNRQLCGLTGHSILFDRNQVHAAVASCYPDRPGCRTTGGRGKGHSKTNRRACPHGSYCSILVYCPKSIGGENQFNGKVSPQADNSSRVVGEMSCEIGPSEWDPQNRDGWHTKGAAQSEVWPVATGDSAGICKMNDQDARKVHRSCRWHKTVVAASDIFVTIFAAAPIPLQPSSRTRRRCLKYETMTNQYGTGPKRDQLQRPPGAIVSRGGAVGAGCGGGWNLP